MPNLVNQYKDIRIEARIIFIMGVSGVGKSTIGNLLSEKLDLPFFDGDDFHPKENILKMSQGQPLNDQDRFGWLKTLNELAKSQLKHKGCIIVCSALKKSYRELLNNSIQEFTSWIFLNGSFTQIQERINNRKGHFMNSDLLKSQFDILETPKKAIEIDISLTPQEIVKVIEKELLAKTEFGLFGLGVMGKSLSRNLAKNGYKISLFNRHVDGIEENVAKNFKNEHSELTQALGFDDIREFVNSIQEPRCIMLMVNAGKTIDFVIEDLLPHLSKGDIIIDGGNSNYKKTKQRNLYLKSKGIQFIGTGVSGGEVGALNGPSLMPSGEKSAYDKVAPFLEKISAKDKDGLPCCTYVGPEGSGQFIKMVHNGIEYVEMQLLAEVSTILEHLGQNPSDISNTLSSWQESANSYLLEITSSIFNKKDGENWLVKKILDKAGNKGTGNWTAIASAELGVPSTLVTSALFSRYISFYKEERLELSKNFRSSDVGSLSISADEILRAYQFARIINHYQGFKLIDEASTRFDWNLNLSEIARIWTNGCIIRSSLMEELVDVFKETSNILTNSKIIEILNRNRPSIKNVVSQCLLNDIVTPALSESAQFLNGITIEYSSANIIQAQRDCFGAHTYKMLDDKSGKSYHSNWM